MTFYSFYMLQEGPTGAAMMTATASSLHLHHLNVQPHSLQKRTGVSAKVFTKNNVLLALEGCPRVWHVQVLSCLCHDKIFLQ